MLNTLAGANILYPLFVQVALSFGLLFWLAAARTHAVRNGELKLSDIALGQQGGPADILQIANSYRSQFELPALFYLVVILALATGKADPQMGLLAWLFVVLRLWHAYIHTTNNDVLMRFRAFAMGALALLVMWGMLFYSLVVEGA